jgi:hypothetical protein
MDKISIFKLELEDIRTICYNGDYGRLQVIQDTKKRHYDNLAAAELITRQEHCELREQLAKYVKAEFSKEADRL